MDELASTNRIALFDGEASRRARMRSLLEGQGVVELADTAELAETHDVAVVDGAKVSAVVAALRSRGAEVPVVAVVASADRGSEAIRNGAYDYVTEPIDRDRLELVVRRARERQELGRRVRALQHELATKNGHANGNGNGEEVVPLRELERRAIEKALHATRGSVEKAAKMLGMGRATLYRRLATMGASRTV